MVADLLGSWMTRDTFLFVKDLHDTQRRPNPDLLVNQHIGNTVVMSIPFHVIIDVDASLLPRCVLIGTSRKRL